MNPFDITGQKSGRWTVISRAENTHQGQAQWLCRCECGTEKILKSIIIRRNISKSCGCLKLEELKRRSTKHGHAPSGHYSKTYNSWYGMIKRCTNPNSQNYKYYGGKGITVCERWKSDFRNFLADMGQKPNGMTLDRIDYHLGYTPENCRWATWKEQNSNKKSNRLLTLKGETATVTEWARRLSVPQSTLSDAVLKEIRKNH